MAANQLTQPRRILLIEDHLSFREALTHILNSEPDLKVVGQAGSLAEGRELSRSNGFEVAVVDLFLPDGDGTDLIRGLLKVSPGASVLMLTVSTDPARLARARESGVEEVLSKASSVAEVIGAIRHSGNGTVVVP